MNATAINIDSGEPPQYALRSGVGNTTVAPLETSPEYGITSNRSEGRFSYVVKMQPVASVPAADQIREMLGPPTRNVVRVDVHEVDADVARCQIADFGGQDVTVALPLALFPEDQMPSFGRSYDLQMVVENGIRRAVLAARPPNLAALREKKQVLRDLVQQIGGTQ